VGHRQSIDLLHRIMMRVLPNLFANVNGLQQLQEFCPCLKLLLEIVRHLAGVLGTVRLRNRDLRFQRDALKQHQLKFRRMSGPFRKRHLEVVRLRPPNQRLSLASQVLFPLLSRPLKI